MSIYDVFNGGGKPFNKEEWRRRSRRKDRKPMS